MLLASQNSCVPKHSPSALWADGECGIWDMHCGAMDSSFMQLACKSIHAVWGSSASSAHSSNTASSAYSTCSACASRLVVVVVVRLWSSGRRIRHAPSHAPACRRIPVCMQWACGACVVVCGALSSGSVEPRAAAPLQLPFCAGLTLVQPACRITLAIGAFCETRSGDAPISRGRPGKRRRTRW